MGNAIESIKMENMSDTWWDSLRFEVELDGRMYFSWKATSFLYDIKVLHFSSFDADVV